MKLENWSKWDGETRPFTTSDPQAPPSEAVHRNAIRENKDAIGIAWYEAGFDHTQEAIDWSVGPGVPALASAVAVTAGFAQDVVELPWRLAQIGKDALDIALHGIAIGWKKLF